MEAITTLVKLLAVAIATTFVGAPIGPTIDAPITIEEQVSTEGSGDGSGGTTSNSNAANKVSAAGSTIEHMCATVEDAACKLTVTLFSEAIKISDPKDLLIEVNAECALWTEVVVVDDDDSNTPEVDVPHSESEARVTVQVLLDGIPVGVNEFDNGEVV